MHLRASGLLLSVALVIVGCGSDLDGQQDQQEQEEGQDGQAGDEQRYPDVVAAELEPTEDAWRLSATISSPYDTPDRYADAFRAITPDGEELGVRELLHDHAGEQPFTRSLDGLEIPDDVDRIVVEGRDLDHGWGGETVTITVPDT
ncbi:MAG: hypothetical protein ACOCT8_00415 [Actinomycetota bacterium]